MKKLYVMAVFFVTIYCMGKTSYANSVIVAGGESDYTIIVSKEASSVEQFAASELQSYIEQMSGVKLPIQEAGPVSGESNGIYVGEELVRQQGISIPASELGWDGFILESSGNNIYLAGLKQRGTLYAAYDLLERMGARWFAPDFEFYAPAQGEMIPQLSEISIPELHVISKPDLKYRKKYVEEGWTHTPENMAKLIDWMAKTKMNVFVHPVNYRNRDHTIWDSVRTQLIPELQKRGMVVEIGGHGYQTYLPPSQYFDEHPEWFGMKDGERSQEERVVFNTTNKDALSTLAQNISDYLKERPEVDIFDLWPPDAAQWSEDPESMAQGTPSDRQAIVLNYIAQELKDDFPDLKIEFLAYADYIEPPPAQKITADNLLMDYAPLTRSYAFPFWDYGHFENAEFDKALHKWIDGEAYTGEISFYSYYRKYAWRSLPIVFPRLIAREIHYFDSLGLVGMGSYSEPGDWFTYELNHYVIAKSSWNSLVDVHSLITDYTTHRYKEASEIINRYIWLMEETTRKANRIPHTEVKTETLNDYSGNLQKAESLLDSALTKTEDTAVRSLLEKLKLTLEYARLDLKVRELGFEIASNPGHAQNTDHMELQKHYKDMTELFDENLDKGIFISRGNRYY